jgi:hypothetical protein
LTGSERNATLPPPAAIRIAVPEFLAVGGIINAFLSGSVKGGGRYPLSMVQLILPQNFVIPSAIPADVIK